MDHKSHLVKRPTLVKTRVGCVKGTTRDLPPPDHTYGYSRPEDPEGAGDSEYNNAIRFVYSSTNFFLYRQNQQLFRIGLLQIPP